jgi:hypothetical protein
MQHRESITHKRKAFEPLAHGGNEGIRNEFTRVKEWVSIGREELGAYEGAISAAEEHCFDPNTAQWERDAEDMRNVLGSMQEAGLALARALTTVGPELVLQIPHIQIADEVAQMATEWLDEARKRAEGKAWGTEAFSQLMLFQGLGRHILSDPKT